MRLVLIFALLGFNCSVFAQTPDFLASTLKYTKNSSIGGAVESAIKNEELIKLRFDGEGRVGESNVNLVESGDKINILLGDYGTNVANLLVIAESIGGDIPPVIVDSKISNLRYTAIRLLSGDFCKNRHFLVTVLLEFDGTLYWNSRKADSIMTDCGQFSG